MIQEGSLESENDLLEMEIPDEIPTESVTENEKELIHDTRRTQVAKDYNDSGKKQ